MAGVVHIVGLPVTVHGRYRRQRCAWCGAIIQDDDLERLAWSLNGDGSDPGPPGMWEVGAMVELDGPVTVVHEPEEPDKLPPNACAMLDPSVTA